MIESKKIFPIFYILQLKFIPLKRLYLKIPDPKSTEDISRYAFNLGPHLQQQRVEVSIFQT
ncbi:hypothetical protein DLD82_18045 [Methanospirillum stamsii]|uniref:Uncharacterized protein n=1 Tax=Methanospirillum stamsii TaxID=1277351 RepID=A0A2V2MVS1_9EURY|nr:hypothetical protein DLD82_18045 [Methanospirillum stamsii]